MQPPSELVLLCVDNSESARNGDYPPSRWVAQRVAVSALVSHFVQSKSASVVLITLGNSKPTLACCATNSRVRLLDAMNSITCGGEILPIQTLLLCEMVIRNTLVVPKEGTDGANLPHARIILFLGSNPSTQDSALLPGVYISLEGLRTSIDVISYGDFLHTSDTEKSVYTSLTSLFHSPPSLSRLLEVAPHESLRDRVLSLYPVEDHPQDAVSNPPLSGGILAPNILGGSAAFLALAAERKPFSCLKPASQVSTIMKHFGDDELLDSVEKAPQFAIYCLSVPMAAGGMQMIPIRLSEPPRILFEVKAGIINTLSGMARPLPKKGMLSCWMAPPSLFQITWRERESEQIDFNWLFLQGEASLRITRIADCDILVFNGVVKNHRKEFLFWVQSTDVEDYNGLPELFNEYMVSDATPEFPQLAIEDVIPISIETEDLLSYVATPRVPLLELTPETPEADDEKKQPPGPPPVPQTESPLTREVKK